MKRLIEKQLIDWSCSSRRKPLILRGARQVGKTWLVETVLAKQFESFVKIDLEKRQDLHVIFDGNLDPRRILESLETAASRIIPGKTLLFFDEIQACPRAIVGLRYFYEEMPELHVIAAGSLFEFAIGEISVPVGRIQYIHLQPMTFYEYLLALDMEQMAQHILDPQQNTAAPIRQMIFSELKKYLFIGGMPESVKTYKESGSLLEAFSVQTEILDSYRDDFSKYKPHVNSASLDTVLREAAVSVGEQVKYTRLDKEHSGPTNKKALEVLAKARILNKIPSCDPSGLPLGATANNNKFKISMLDIGLFQRICQVPADKEMLKTDLLAMYQGKLAEQFVAQELIAWHTQNLHYWARDAKSSNAEVDFLTVRNAEIYPVEVKSGTGGSLKSLHLMLKQYPNCPGGLVLYSGPYKELPEQKLTFLPLYATPHIGDRSQLSP